MAVVEARYLEEALAGMSGTVTWEGEDGVVDGRTEGA